VNGTTYVVEMRKQELQSLDAAALQELLAKLRTARRWP
jgi:hypothetical protein